MIRQETGSPGCFMSLLKHGYERVALVIPIVHLGDPEACAEELAKELDKVYEQGAVYAVSTELGLGGYSCGDLFRHATFQNAAVDAMQWLLDVSADRWKDMLITVGMALVVRSALYNCAVTFQNGCVLGVTPKTYLPNYGEFEEKYWFVSAVHAKRLGLSRVRLCGQEVPFGNDVMFAARNRDGLVIHVSICEDDWKLIPPGHYAALAGATVRANLSASNALIGKDVWREKLAQVISGCGASAFLYCSAWFGESTRDLSWDGSGLIAERGNLLARTERFCDLKDRLPESKHVVHDIDIQSLLQDRVRENSTTDNAAECGRPMLTVEFTARGEDTIDEPTQCKLLRDVDAHPFVPQNAAERDDRCRETFMIQTTALVNKLRSLPPHMRKIILGVSGGQDSTQALLVAAKAVDMLGLPRTNIIGVTMPGFGTTSRTYLNACNLITELGASFREISIKDHSALTFYQVMHPEADGVDDATVQEKARAFAATFIAEVKAGIAANDDSREARLRRTFFENVQAWSRKHVLFSMSGFAGGMVLGTGDLSELMVGWCTMFGDHSSHYGINAGVAKTLISHLIRWVADVEFAGEPKVQAVLYDILATEISPELLPPDKDGKIAQKSEDSVGPYELVDFFGYYLIRWGYTPEKIMYLAAHAFKGKYDWGTLRKWLGLFIERFFGSRFKCACLPEGPKVGMVSVSPRGDLRLPTDAKVTRWKKQHARIPETAPATLGA